MKSFHPVVTLGALLLQQLFVTHLVAANDHPEPMIADDHNHVICTDPNAKVLAEVRKPQILANLPLSPDTDRDSSCRPADGYGAISSWTDWYSAIPFGSFVVGAYVRHSTSEVYVCYAKWLDASVKASCDVYKTA